MELSKLNSDKAYIQVTFAEPYFDNYGKFDEQKRPVFISLENWELMDLYRNRIFSTRSKDWSDKEEGSGRNLYFTQR